MNSRQELKAINPQERLNFLFKDAFNTFYLRLYGDIHMAKDHSNRKETCCHNYMGCSFYLHQPRQDNTYHGLCYTSCRALAGMRNNTMNPPRGIHPMTLYTMSRCSTISLLVCKIKQTINISAFKKVLTYKFSLLQICWAFTQK